MTLHSHLTDYSIAVNGVGGGAGLLCIGDVVMHMCCGGVAFLPCQIV